MSESIIHREYVKKIYEHCLNMIPKNQSRLILLDGNDNLILKEAPPIIGGFRPDLYYEFDSLLIIGEAKTLNDISTKHSLNQYREYIKCCAHYWGTAYFIVCCPWMCTADMKSIIKKISSNFQKEINIIFLDELSGDRICKK